MDGHTTCMTLQIIMLSRGKTQRKITYFLIQFVESAN